MMERKQILVVASFCAIVFGAVSVLNVIVSRELASNQQLFLRHGGEDNRFLRNNYLWQRDDDDGYFSNSNNTGYFSSNQNYKKMGNNNYNSNYNNYNANYNGAYNDASAYTDDGSQGDDDATGDDSTGVSKESWMSNLSPSQSAFIGIGIGLVLLLGIFCFMMGPTLWALFTNWLLNRKTDAASNFTTMADF